MNPVQDEAAPVGDDSDAIRKIRSLPKAFGVFLLVAGVGGVLIPGPIGAPLLVLGGVVLWPRAFRGVEDSFRRRFPEAHRLSLRQVVRYLDDLERRYPDSPTKCE